MNSLRMPDYQVTGDGDVTIYLLHGGYGSKDYFRNQIETLVSRGYRVVAWDAPGYGLSPLPVAEDGDYSISSLAGSFVRLLKLTAGKTNILLGHSLGGIIAPRAACLAPDLVHGVIVSATVGSFATRSEADKKEYIEKRITPLEKGATLAESAMPLIKSMFGPGASGPDVELVTQVAASTSAPTFKASILAIMNYDGRDTLRQLRVPTLFVAGEHDIVGRPDGMKQASSLTPHSEYVCISGAGHYAWAERHDEFNAALFDFIDRRIAQTSLAA